MHRIILLIDAIKSQLREFLIRVSQSLTRRLHRQSQANVLSNRAGVQAGIGAEAGVRADLGENQRVGFGAHAKATAVGGATGGLYFGVDWSSKNEE